jgi:uncharacterized protein YkwD
VLQKTHVYGFFIGFFVLFGVFASGASAAPLRGMESGFLQAVNSSRAANGLRPLRLDLRLRTAARAHSVEMLRRNSFTHGNFAARMAAFHIRSSAGENLAWGSGSYASPQTVISEWLRSPEHRANLLRATYTRIGIGLARGTFLGYGGSTVVTADFAH